MRNIPVFTTPFGAASLVLEKIPYTKEAYIVLQDSLEPEKLLHECLDFCQSAGAGSVYATGHDFLEMFPYHTSVISMVRSMEGLPQTDAALFPVQEHTLAQWRAIYNERMCQVPNASYLTIRESERLLREGKCYFVHRDRTLLGIGAIGSDSIRTIASTVPGAGRDVLLALCSAICGDTVKLEVADNNIPAMKLYNGLDFVKTGVISAWYKII